MSRLFSPVLFFFCGVSIQSSSGKYEAELCIFFGVIPIYKIDISINTSSYIYISCIHDSVQHRRDCPGVKHTSYKKGSLFMNSKNYSTFLWVLGTLRSVCSFVLVIHTASILDCLWYGFYQKNEKVDFYNGKTERLVNSDGRNEVIFDKYSNKLVPLEVKMVVMYKP